MDTHVKIFVQNQNRMGPQVGEEPRKKEKSEKGKDFSVAKQFTIWYCLSHV